MLKNSWRWWVRFAVLLLSVFGVAVAVAAVVVSLPSPAAGGTCGPGHGSEAPIVAFVNPGSIGAGPEPAAASTLGRLDWMAFVGECQSAADGRVLIGLGILALSVGALVGTLLATRREEEHSAVETDAATTANYFDPNYVEPARPASPPWAPPPGWGSAFRDAPSAPPP